MFVIPFWCIKKHNPWFLKGCGKIHSLFGSTIRDYSTIVATRPDPTVRPPSRCFWEEIYLFEIDFACFIGSYYLGFHVISVVFEIFRTILEPPLLMFTSGNIIFKNVLWKFWNMQTIICIVRINDISLPVYYK